MAGGNRPYVHVRCKHFFERRSLVSIPSEIALVSEDVALRDELLSGAQSMGDSQPRLETCLLYTSPSPRDRG